MSKVTGIDELVVHPDYYESRDLKHGNPYDIALIKTKKVIIVEIKFATVG